MKRIWAGAACAAMMACGLAAMPATVKADGSRWTRTESTHFIVYSDADDDRTRDFVGRLEAFDELADKLYRQIGDSELPDYGKHIFYYLDKIDDYNTVRPGSVSEYGITFQPYTTCPFEDMRYFGINMGEKKQAQTSEYLNLDLSYTYFAYVQSKNIKFFSAPLPGWLDRGLKDYLMTMNIQPDKVVVGQMLPEMAADLNTGPKHYIPLSMVVSNTAPRASDSTTLNAEGWFLVHWLAATPENRQMLTAYIAKTRDGEDPLKAFIEVTSKNPDDLMPVYKDYLAKGVPVQVFAHPQPISVAVTPAALPHYGPPLPLLDAAVSACSDPIQRRSLLGDLRPVAKTYPDDALVQRALLRAEVVMGDVKKGEVQAAQAPLEAIVAAHPEDAEALTLLGQLHLRLAEAAAPDAGHPDYAAARAALGQAYKLDASSPTILALFSRARADLPGYPDDQAVQAMALAQSYSSGIYKLYMVELDVRRDDYDAALKRLADERPDHLSGDWKTQMTAILDGLKAHKAQADVLPRIVAYEQLRFKQ